MCRITRRLRMGLLDFRVSSLRRRGRRADRPSVSRHRATTITKPSSDDVPATAPSPWARRAPELGAEVADETAARSTRRRAGRRRYAVWSKLGIERDRSQADYRIVRTTRARRRGFPLCSELGHIHPGSLNSCHLLWRPVLLDSPSCRGLGAVHSRQHGPTGRPTARRAALHRTHRGHLSSAPPTPNLKFVELADDSRRLGAVRSLRAPFVGCRSPGSTVWRHDRPALLSAYRTDSESGF